VRGVIYTSGLTRNVFTAGNDLKELYAPGTTFERYKRFWLISNIFLARLLNSPLVTVAAVKGATPAGGCALALCCDTRVMAKGATIGLNEVAIGLSVPEYFMAQMSRIIGVKETERLCLGGLMVDAGEAERIKLVDYVVADPSELLGEATRLMNNWLKLQDVGREETKRQLRHSLATEFGDEARLTKEVAEMWVKANRPRNVAALKATMDRLSGKSKSKI